MKIARTPETLITVDESKLLRSHFLKTAFCFLFAFTQVGCAGISVHSEKGTTHRIIIGIGVVSTGQQPGVSVQDCRALGLVCGQGGLQAGLSQQHDVAIDPKIAEDVVISIRATPFSLTVTNFNPYPPNHPTTNAKEERK